MHEPTFGARVAGRIDRFLSPLQKSLRVSERAFLFRVTGRREEKNFRLDFFRLQFATLDLGRIAPECGRFDLDHFAHDQPF